MKITYLLSVIFLLSTVHVHANQLPTHQEESNKITIPSDKIASDEDYFPFPW